MILNSSYNRQTTFELPNILSFVFFSFIKPLLLLITLQYFILVKLYQFDRIRDWEYIYKHNSVKKLTIWCKLIRDTLTNYNVRECNFNYITFCNFIFPVPPSSSDLIRITFLWHKQTKELLHLDLMCFRRNIFLKELKDRKFVQAPNSLISTHSRHQSRFL